MNKNNDDISSSLLKSRLTEFRLCVQMMTIRLSKESVNGEERDVFKEHLKLLALLYAAGKESRDVLQSPGFNLHDLSVTDEQVMKHLASVSGSEENVYVETMKFVNSFTSTQ